MMAFTLAVCRLSMSNPCSSVTNDYSRAISQQPLASPPALTSAEFSTSSLARRLRKSPSLHSKLHCLRRPFTHASSTTSLRSSRPTFSSWQTNKQTNKQSNKQTNKWEQVDNTEEGASEDYCLLGSKLCFLQKYPS